MSGITFHKLTGSLLQTHAADLARLRITVFREFPYLYDGDMAYEKAYIDRYGQSRHGVMVVALDQDKVVGASTGMPMLEETSAFRLPLEQAGMDCRCVYYFGESVLLPAYRGRGIGRRLMQERIDHVDSLHSYSCISFCAVDRPADHPMRPVAYRPLDGFWAGFGFTCHRELKAVFNWKEVGQQQETRHELTFWMRQT